MNHTYGTWMEWIVQATDHEQIYKTAVDLYGSSGCQTLPVGLVDQENQLPI